MNDSTLKRIGRTIYARDPLYQHLSIEEDNSVLNKITGQRFTEGTLMQNMTAAQDTIRTMPTSVVRTVMSDDMTGVGAAALRTRVALINNFLSASTTSEDELRELKLEKLIGKQIRAQQVTFGLGGNKEQLLSVLDPMSSYSQKIPGSSNITSEGLIRTTFAIMNTDGSIR